MHARVVPFSRAVAVILTAVGPQRNLTAMANTLPDPGWTEDDNGCIVLSGRWSLLVDKRQRRRLLREFERFDPPHEYRWNLWHLDALDSTGALILWQIWEGRLPRQLECSPAQRNLFGWLLDMEPLAGSNQGAESHWLQRFGAGVLLVLQAGGGLCVLLGRLMLDLAYCVRHPRATPWMEISANIRHIGAMAMLLLGTIGFLIGGVMTVQVGFVLQRFDAASMVIGMMATAVPRELGAVVTGLLMAGRTGSAMTASIGAMHITEEYSALQAFGSSPSLRLALPRVIGAVIAMPLLVVWTNCTIALGSAVVAQAQLGIDYQLFLAQMVQQIQIVNFWIGIGKGALFGLVIAVVGCYFGMTANPDTESMSSHTTISVVTSLTAVLLLDAALGAAMTNIGLM